jgi:hypothetical protein
MTVLKGRGGKTGNIIVIKIEMLLRYRHISQRVTTFNDTELKQQFTFVIWRQDTQHIDPQQNGTHSLMPQSIMTLSITALSKTIDATK